MQHVHGREDACLSSLDQGLSDVDEHVMDRLHAVRHQAKEVQRVDDGAVDPDGGQDQPQSVIPEVGIREGRGSEGDSIGGVKR